MPSSDDSWPAEEPGPEGSVPAWLLRRVLGSAEMRARLAPGAEVADVGCGAGRSTLLVARLHPRARVLGLDPCPRAIAGARAHARRDGASGRVRFVRGGPFELRPGRYDLVLCRGLCRWADPATTAEHIARCLASRGSLLVVEPGPAPGGPGCDEADASSALERLVLSCMRAPLVRLTRRELEDRVREARLREVLARAGFARVLRVVEPPAPLVLQAWMRPPGAPRSGGHGVNGDFTPLGCPPTCPPK